jgi:hypothetical protein
LAPLFRRRLQHVPGTAGIVDENVDRAEVLLDLLDRSLAGFEVGDVEAAGANARRVSSAPASSFPI